MNDYPKVVVSDKAEVLMGQSPPSAACTEAGEGLPFIQGNAEFGVRHPIPRLKCSSPTRMAEAGDLLLSVRAPVGELNQATELTVIGRGLSALRFEPNERNYAWHAVKWSASGLNRVAQGSTFVAVSRQDVEKLEIPWHGEANERIAFVLDAIDNAIAKSEAVIGKLKQVRAGMHHDLLTRGIDENGELRDPVAHPEQFKDSPMGVIPKEWDVAPLSKFVPSAEYGISSSLGDKGTPVLRMNNFEHGEAKLNDLKYSSSFIPPKLIIKKGDVFFNRTNSWEHVGRTGIWRGQLAVATFASYLVRLNPRTDLLNPELLNYWLNWAPIQIRMRRYATPAVQQVNINPTNLRTMDAAFPNCLDEQSRMIAYIQSDDSAIVRANAELTKLKNLKAGLNTDLLTGRKRVLEGSTL